MAKPTIQDLFDAGLEHQRRIGRIAHDARKVDQPKFEREAKQDLRIKFEEWGIADAFDWEM